MANPGVGVDVGKFAPTGESKNVLWTILVLAVVGIVLYIIIKSVGGIGALFNGIAEALHLKDDKQTAANRQTVQDAIDSSAVAQNAFNPEMYKSAPAGTRLVTSSTAKSIAKQVWDSVGSFWDDPESGLAAIKQCPTQAAVSFVADNFNSLYQRDMLDWLKIKYDTREQLDTLSQIVKYVSNLPKY